MAPFYRAVISFLCLSSLACCALAELPALVDTLVPIEKDDYNYKVLVKDPKAWKRQHPNCNGTQQSPVALSTATATTSRRNDTVCGKYMCLRERIHMSPSDNTAYGRARATRARAILGNSGHHLALDFPKGSTSWYINSTGRLYNLYDVKQLSFHFPAEHVIDGQRHLGELQILTENPTRRKIVVSLLLTDGADKPLPFFEQLGLPDNIPKAGWARRVEAHNLDLAGAFGKELSGSFFRYDGSLSTPPCTEDVYWLVMRHPAPVLWRGAATAFQNVLGPTARPLQKLGQRTIMLDSILVYAQEEVGDCPEPNEAGESEIVGCVRTCRINPKFLDGNGRPLANTSIKCPEPCPIQAPCTEPSHVRCIVGSSTMDSILKESGVVPWDAPELRATSFCEYYDPVSQADLENRACVTCRVSMCAVCGSADTCKSCLSGYIASSDGKTCTDTWTPMWWLLYPVVIAGLLFYVAWLTSLSLRAGADEDGKVLKAATWSKWVVRPRDFSRSKGRAFAPWAIWQWHCGDRLGAGITAFFNFMWLVILTIATTGAIHCYYENRNKKLAELVGGGDDDDGFSARCALSAQPPKILQDEVFYRETITAPMLKCSLTAFAAAWVLTFCFAVWFHGFKERSQRRSVLNRLSSCCVVLESLPENVPVDVVEAWVTSILRFRGMTTQDLVGVSMVFRTPGREPRFRQVFEETIQLIVEEADEHLERSKSDAAEDTSARKGSWRCCSFSAFHSLDGICGYDFSGSEVSQDGCLGWRLGRAVQCLKGAGVAHVVFRSEEAARTFLETANMVPPKHSPGLSRSWQWLTGRNHGDCDPREIQMLTQPLIFEAVDERGSVPLVFDGAEYHPFASSRTGAPQSVDWSQYGQKIAEVKNNFWEIPTRITKSFALMLALLIPNMLFFRKHARSTADTPGWQWQLQTQVLGFVVGLGYQAMGGSAWEVCKTFGATTVEKQRMVMLSFIVCCAGVVTAANLLFTLKVMTPAWKLHMVQMGQRPTDMGAQMNNLFNTVWPGTLAVGYVVEPLMGLLVPQYVNYNVCRSRGGTRSASERSLRFPQVDPTWQLADLVVNTSLCFTLLWYVGPKVWQACLHYAILLVARYLYLAITWAVTATKQTFSTTEQVEMALLLWARIPLGLLGAVVGHWSAKHWFGLHLPPVGLPNGPTEDPKWAAELRRCATVSALLFNLLASGMVLEVAKRLSTRIWRPYKTNYTYDLAKEVSPADYFNTNANLALIVQSVCAGDPMQLISKLPKEIRKQGLLKFAEVFLRCADESKTAKNQKSPYRQALKGQAIALAAFLSVDSKDPLLEEVVENTPKFLTAYEGSKYKNLISELRRQDSSLLNRVLRHHAERSEPSPEIRKAVQQNANQVLMVFKDGKEYLQGGMHARYYETIRQEKPRKALAYSLVLCSWALVALAAFMVSFDIFE